MNDQLKMKEKKQVSINGIRQNCYVLDTRTALQDSVSIKPETHYPSLERKQLPNGFVEGVEVKDYPINSKSVTSYADGADYRNDPMQAVANAPKRVNLGDVSQVQEFLESDPQSAVRVFRDVLARLEQYQKSNPTPTPTPAPTEDK